MPQSKKFQIIISPKSIKDLQEILIYTDLIWGQKLSEKYLNKIYKSIYSLS